MEAPTQVTRNGGFAASLSPDGRSVYYTRDAGLDTSLWRMPVGVGEESRVLGSVTAFNYSVADDGVYFVAPSAPRVCHSISQLHNEHHSSSGSRQTVRLRIHGLT